MQPPLALVGGAMVRKAVWGLVFVSLRGEKSLGGLRPRGAWQP